MIGDGSLEVDLLVQRQVDRSFRNVERRPRLFIELFQRRRRLDVFGRSLEERLGHLNRQRDEFLAVGAG